VDHGFIKKTVKIRMKKKNYIKYLYFLSWIFSFVFLYLNITDKTQFYDVAGRFSLTFMFCLVFISPQSTVLLFSRNKNDMGEPWAIIWRILSIIAIINQMYYINIWFYETHTLIYLNWKTILLQYVKAIF